MSQVANNMPKDKKESPTISQSPCPPVSLSTPATASDTFLQRHLGPNPTEVRQMLDFLEYSSLDEMIHTAIPANIRLKRSLNIPHSQGEHEILCELRKIAAQNQVFRS